MLHLKILNFIKEVDKSYMYSTGKLIQVKELRKEEPMECSYVRIGINKVKETPAEIDKLIDILKEIKEEIKNV